MKQALDKAAQNIRRVVTGKQGGEATPPPEQFQETPQEAPQEDTEQEAQQEEYIEVHPPPGSIVYVTDQETEEEPDEEGGCIQGYAPGVKVSKHGYIFPRWFVQYPDLNCIRSLLNTVPKLDFYSMVICGRPNTEYPGKEGEDIICITYRISSNVAWIPLSDNSVTDAVSYTNAVNDFMQLVDSWVYIEEISILDRPG